MQAINSVEEYYVMYFDIDNFKAYNDVYGFENWDRICEKDCDVRDKQA